MIKASNNSKKYQVLFSNGIHSGVADTTNDKGGADSGFRPHDLLEAALATCLVMWLRMYGESHGIDAAGVEATVALERSNADIVIYNYSLSFPDGLVQEEKRKLLAAAGSCPVHRTLSKAVVVKAGERLP